LSLICCEKHAVDCHDYDDLITSTHSWLISRYVAAVVVLSWWTDHIERLTSSPTMLMI